MKSGSDKQASAGLRYLAVSGAVALLALMVVGLFNGVIDPLGMFNLADLPGLNRHKPAVYTRVRIAKAYELRRVAPNTVHFVDDLAWLDLGDEIFRVPLAVAHANLCGLLRYGLVRKDDGSRWVRRA